MSRRSSRCRSTCTVWCRSTKVSPCTSRPPLARRGALPRRRHRRRPRALLPARRLLPGGAADARAGEDLPGAAARRADRAGAPHRASGRPTQGRAPRGCSVRRREPLPLAIPELLPGRRALPAGRRPAAAALRALRLAHDLAVGRCRARAVRSQQAELRRLRARRRGGEPGVAAPSAADRRRHRPGERKPAPASRRRVARRRDARRGRARSWARDAPLARARGRAADAVAVLRARRLRGHHHRVHQTLPSARSTQPVLLRRRCRQLLALSTLDRDAALPGLEADPGAGGRAGVPAAGGGDPPADRSARRGAREAARQRGALRSGPRRGALPARRAAARGLLPPHAGGRAGVGAARGSRDPAATEPSTRGHRAPGACSRWSRPRRPTRRCSCPPANASTRR